ncbi:MAG: SLC13 family permease [Planctomycetota bacterium]
MVLLEDSIPTKTAAAEVTQGLPQRVSLGMLVAIPGSIAELELHDLPIEFVLFGLTLLGVALFHKHALAIAVGGLTLLFGYRVGYTDFDFAAHFFGGLDHGEGEWKLLVNLLGLLLGFALLAKQFEDSHVPELLPNYLPNGVWGGVSLLGLVFVMSAFLDNIAAAIIGGTIAKVVYRGKVHLGFLAALVASSNAGGAGSVVGDTTTTMLWIEGVSPIQVLPAFIAAAASWVVLAFFAGRQQHRLQPIASDAPRDLRVDKGRLLIVVLILIGAIATNIWLDFPALGVWIAILIGACYRSTGWHELQGAFKGALFLLSLVMSASLMPVDQLPAATWQTTFGLGFVSSVFDNIPLTKLALDQGGYDWGLLAFAVGFGGSMVWFGSSAGVAVSNTFSEARSVLMWLRKGWHVPVAYVVGFMALYLSLGWHPKSPASTSVPDLPSLENQKDR